MATEHVVLRQTCCPALRTRTHQRSAIVLAWRTCHQSASSASASTSPAPSRAQPSAQWSGHSPPLTARRPSAGWAEQRINCGGTARRSSGGVDDVTAARSGSVAS